jgi:hypothetical protein
MSSPDRSTQSTPILKIRDLREYYVDLSEYEQRGILGLGASGQVWKGQSRITGWTVAVKQLQTSKLDPEALESFQREIDILIRCNNKFLIDFIGFTSSPPYCILTSFMPGGSLWDALHTKRPGPNATQKTNIAMGIAHGMKYLHSQRIVHRDLKSPNVLLDERLLPKIADFGIGRVNGDCGPATDGYVGTPMWMAPELMDSKPYGPAVDVYAFGIILWEMYTEKVPFEGLDQVQICAQVSTRGLRPELPETQSTLAVLIQQCWDAEPTHRPSFEEIYARFEARGVFFPNCEPRGSDILIHEIQQHDEINKNAAIAAANNLNEMIALKRAGLKPPEVIAALVKCAREGDVGGITRLIGAYPEKADLNGRDANGVCPLHAAVQAGKILAVDYLMKLPTVDKNITDAEGNTALMATVKKGTYPRIVQMLAKMQDVDVNARNNAGQTALHLTGLLDPKWQKSNLNALAMSRALKVDIVDAQGKLPFADAPDVLQAFLQKQRV